MSRFLNLDTLNQPDPAAILSICMRLLGILIGCRGLLLYYIAINKEKISKESKTTAKMRIEYLYKNNS
jgi:hypothetical protein